MKKLRCHNYFNYGKEFGGHVLNFGEEDINLNKGSITPPADAVSKEEFSKILSKNEQLEQEMADLREEILTPDYLDFIANKRNDTSKKGNNEPLAVKSDDFEKLSKAELYARAKADALAEMSDKISKLELGIQEKTESQKRNEVDQFARMHSDFEQYRPVMYGLSTKRENANLSLNELYEKAKTHIDAITASAEQKKQAQIKNKGVEKPGGSSFSFETVKGLNNTEISTKALIEVQKTLGDLPNA